MSGEVPRFYFDANVLLAYVSDEQNRAVVVQELLRQAGEGSVTIMTSTMSIAEVAFGAEEKIHRQLDEHLEDRLNTLWAPGSPITLVEASRRVLIEARALIRANLAKDCGRLTPIDAVHLATAKIEAVDELMTYELNTRSRWAELTGLPVTEPSLAQPPLDFGA